MSAKWQHIEIYFINLQFGSVPSANKDKQKQDITLCV